MYKAEISGSSWSRGPQAEFSTIRECRAWAEEYGRTADRCSIYDKKGKLVALHCRDENGNGMKWFRARRI